jgi:hypothetical protein
MTKNVDFSAVFPKHTEPFTYSQVTITPEVAKKWLAVRNTHNRNVKGTNVDYLVRHIQNGTFDSNIGLPIMFDTNGVLMNGQHRLLACVKANTPIVIDVKMGLDPAMIANIDAGVERNLQDRYGLLTGRTDDAANETARLNSVLKTFDPHRPKRAADEIDAAYLEFEAGIRTVNKVATARTGMFKADVKADVMAAFVIAATVAPNRVRDLLQGLIDGNTDATALFKYTAPASSRTRRTPALRRCCSGSSASSKARTSRTCRRTRTRWRPSLVRSSRRTAASPLSARSISLGSSACRRLPKP